VQDKKYDAFLSHNSKDKPVVEEIGKYLKKEANLKVFLDSWCLIPGNEWQEDLESALTQSHSCVVFVGQNEIGPWQNEEMRYALDEMVSKRSIRVVPVLLPGVKRPEKESLLPIFLRRRMWVEFQNHWNELDALNRLVCGIKGYFPYSGEAQSVASISNENLCPFRGLEVFREQDSPFFFGREAIVERLVQRLHHTRFLAILGPSGVGKSSIVQAGLIPRLRFDSIIALITPRIDPIEELAFGIHNACLHDVSPQIGRPEEWVKRLKQSADALHYIAREVIEPLKSIGKNRVVLIVDQFEELFTQTSSDVERRVFINLLLKALEKEGGPVTIIITMRSDFLGKCAYYPDLNLFITDFLEQIEPMGLEELKSAVEKPAHKVNLEFEEGLVNLILEDAGGSVGELPLAEHALFELFKNKRGRWLTLSAYRQIGGIAGALTTQAEHEYGTLSNNQKEKLKKMFVMQLVHVGEGNEVTRRRAVKKDMLAVGDENGDASFILTKWTDARLFTVMRDPGHGRDMVDVAHESLIHKWGRLKHWMADWIEVSRHLGLIRQEVREWYQSGKNSDFLYRGVRLAHIENSLNSYSQCLDETVKEFIRAGLAYRESEQRKEQERVQKEAENARELQLIRTKAGKRSRLFRVVVLFISIGMIFFWYVNNKQNEETQDQLAMNYSNSAREAKKNGDSLKALHWLAEAASITTKPEARKGYLQELNNLWDKKELVHIFKHEGVVYKTVFNRDETKILTCSEDGTTRLWDTKTGKLKGYPMKHKGYVLGATFNRDETLILTWSQNKFFSSINGNVQLWDANSGNSTGFSISHNDQVNGAMFTRDESKILTWSLDTTAQLWDVQTRKPINESMKHGDSVNGAIFNKDETKILTWSNDKTARLWEAKTGKPIDVPMKHDAAVNGAAFNSDETMILTWSNDKTARLWDAKTGKPIGVPMKHDGIVKGAIFKRNGTQILAWSIDREDNKEKSKISTVKLWYVKDINYRGFSLIQYSIVNGATFNSDETRILTWSTDGTVQLYDAQNGKPTEAPIKHGGNVKGVIFNRDETKLLTWSDDKTARLWDMKSGKPIGIPMVHNSRIEGATFSREETKIITWSTDGTARLWAIGERKNDNNYNFPLDLIKLKIAALTGTEFDPATGDIKTIEPEHWKKMKEAYLKEATTNLQIQ